jgi:hypothetical protein
MSAPKVSDLTVDELWLALREKMRVLIREELHTQPADMSADDLADFPIDDLGPCPEGLTLRREEIYGDDER